MQQNPPRGATTTLARISFIAGLLLALPAAFWILSDLLAYPCGVWFLFGICYRIIKGLGLHRWVIHNTNTIMVYTPLAALLINLLSVIRINERSSADTRGRRIGFIKSRMNFSVIILSGLILLICLFFSCMGE